jgi:hypothetical protein
MTYRWRCKSSREQDGHGGGNRCCELHDGEFSDGGLGLGGLYWQIDDVDQKTILYSSGAQTIVLYLDECHMRQHLPCSHVHGLVQTPAFSSVPQVRTSKANSIERFFE